MLAARTQSDIPQKADEIFVLVAQGNKVFLAYTKQFGAIGLIAACETIRKDFAKKASDAANETGLSDEARQKKSDELSRKSDSEFLRCFADKAAQQKGYAGAVAAAQALFDRLP